MSTEEQLDILKQQIDYHRRKGVEYRKRAAAQDAIADAKVKEAAALGTPELPMINRTGMEGDPRGSYTPDGTFRMD